MAKWNPEAQHTSLKYNAYIYLLQGLFFSALLGNSLAENYALDLGWLVDGVVITLVAVFIYFTARLALNNHRCSGGWREMLGLYDDEYMRDVVRTANRNICVFLCYFFYRYVEFICSINNFVINISNV